MTPTEEIKVRHVLMQLSPWRHMLSRVPALADKREALSSEQRQELHTYSVEMQRLVPVRKVPDAVPELYELACLEVGWLHNIDDPLAALKALGFTEKRVEQATRWIETLLRAVDFYAALPLPITELVENYARAATGDMSTPRIDEPVTLLTWLASLASLNPDDGTRDTQLRAVDNDLDAAQSRELATYSVALLDSQQEAMKDMAQAILLRLACLVPDGLRGVHLDILHRGLFYPAELYIGADAATSREVVHLIQAGSEHHNHLLDVLAWISDDVAREAFNQWCEDPPSWAVSGAARPQDHTLEAGWQLRPNGERRDLCRLECHQLVPVGDVNMAAEPVRVFMSHEGVCDWCGQGLVTLFDLDLSDAGLGFLDLRGQRLRIAMCYRCSGFGTTYIEVDLDGGSRWSHHNIRPAYLPTEVYPPEYPQTRLVLGTRRPTPWAAHIYVMDDGLSQLGGYPSWLCGGAEWPSCPRCRDAMPFIGQVQMSDFGEPEEGMYYAFHCGSCGIAAVNYQQT